MCTVTFIPRSGGFLLGANRDELWERGRRSTGPKLFSVGDTHVISPRDVHGGTWIAVNDHGLAFALLNRNHLDVPYSKQRSRGEVITALLPAKTSHEVDSLLLPTSVRGMLPFTLLSFSADESRSLEIIWDGQTFKKRDPGWRPRHWFSSGLSDEMAESERSRIAIEAVRDQDHGTPAWMRRFHRAHGRGPGPFSVCVHRDDAGTVSYTEVSVSPTVITMSHVSGSPCLSLPLMDISYSRFVTSV